MSKLYVSPFQVSEMNTYNFISQDSSCVMSSITYKVVEIIRKIRNAFETSFCCNLFVVQELPLFRFTKGCLTFM